VGIKEEDAFDIFFGQPLVAGAGLFSCEEGQSSGEGGAEEVDFENRNGTVMLFETISN
jgi:hypothetical protein